MRWAREVAAPLSIRQPGRVKADLVAVDELIGGASIVALGEAVHGTKDPLQLRNRIFRHLVEARGFTAIAIESGLVEGRLVHEYVRGAAGELATVLSNGIGWTFDQLPANEALVRWLRLHNGAREGRPVHFYGFDVPGSPGNPNVRQGPGIALQAAIRFLERVDPATAAEFRHRTATARSFLRFDFHGRARGYEQLAVAKRDQLTADLAELVATLETNSEAYIYRAGTAEYEWGRQTAEAARQVDWWLREVPAGWEPKPGPIQFPSETTRIFAAATDARDRAQADNVEWIVGQEGKGKVFVYASFFHLSTCPVRTRWREEFQTVAGTYLRKRFGDAFRVIAHLIGGGAYREGHEVHELARPSADSWEGIAAEVGLDGYLLDLRCAPEALHAWLQQVRPIGPAGGGFECALRPAFDAIYYQSRVTPA